MQLDTPNAQGACPSLVVLSQTDYANITLATVGTAEPVTTEQVTAVFTWGFAVVMLFWSFGYVVGVAKQAISKL